MTEIATLIPTGIPAGEVAFPEPGAAYGEAVRLNFAQPAAAPLHLRMAASPTDGAPMIEVQQAHPQGVGWGILEFPVARLPAGTRLRFEMRLLPARTVVLAAHAPGVSVDIASFQVEHRQACFEAVVDAAMAAKLAGAERIQLGLTLPQGTWFIFQVSAATVAFAPPDAVLPAAVLPESPSQGAA